MISVLYVDDEELLLNIGKIFLERLGDFEVTLQDSATRALDLLKTRQFDVIVSDYQMPGMDGLAFLQEVRKHYGNTPFILFTGRGREEIVIRALNDGADFYLQKGGDPKSQFTELVHKVNLSVQRRETEKALAESERRYREVVETQIEFIVRFSPEWIMVFVNEAYCRYLGKHREDILGKRYLPDIPEGDREQVIAHFSSLTPDHPAGETEHRVRMPDGTIRWHWWNNRVLFDDAGTILEYQSVGTDITKRKEAEEELQAANEELQAQMIELRDQQFRLVESEQNYRNILENIQDVYYRTDIDGKLVLASPSLARVLGYDTVSELYGRNIADSLYFNPVQREEFLDEIDRVGMVTNYEIVIKKHDGSPVYVLCSSHTYYTATGERAGIEGVFRDITDRKLMENTLRESENLYRSVFDNTGAGTIIISHDTTILLANASWEKLTGIPRQEQENKRSWTEFISPDDLERMKGYHYARRTDPASAPKVYECTVIDTFKKAHHCVIYVDLIPGSGNSVASLIDISDLKQAESALQESEEKYRAIIEKMQDPFYRTDIEGRLTMVNPAFVKEFGYQHGEDLLGSRIADTVYVHQNQRDELLRLLNKTGEVREFRLSMRRSDGTESTFTASSHLIYDGSQNAIGVEGILHDITDHLRVEEAFADIATKYHELSELLPQMVFEMNPDFQITYANRYALESMGYTQQDITDGLEFSTIIDSWDHEQLRDAIQNQSQSLSSGNHEHIGIKKDGSRVPVLLYITTVYRNTVISGYCGVIIDISERKQMEQALLRSEKLFREVFNNASDEIILHEISPENGPGPFILVNDSTCEKLGYSRDELMRLSLHDILPEENFRNASNITRLLFSDNKVIFESAHRRKDGTEYPIEVNAHLFSINGAPVTLSISRDITERKRAEAALRQANNKLNILSSITRHDLLNKLNALILFLELSRNHVQDNPQGLEYLEKELEITQIMHHQIGFTKSYQDIGIEKPEWTDVDQLFRQAAKYVAIPGVVLDIAVSGLKVYADHLMVKVYYNLLENSLRHGGNISRISITSHTAETAMVIEYCDDGVGIPEENKELIFTKGFGSNTGWGMFLSREILSITNITIREIGIPGKGVRFVIEVPAGHWRQDP